MCRPTVQEHPISGGLAEPVLRVFLKSTQKAMVKTPDSERTQSIDVDAMNERLAAAGLGASSTGEVTGHRLSIQKPRTSVIEH